jgi:hypothetical protein
LVLLKFPDRLLAFTQMREVCMKKAGNDPERILRRVTLAFAKHRRRNDGRSSYSKSLRSLAVSALEAGITPGKVAQAAGVSQQSVGNWLSTGSVAFPRELKVVDDSSDIANEACAAKTPIGSSPAVIRLHSGVSIEIPIAALTPSLLVALNGGER